MAARTRDAVGTTRLGRMPSKDVPRRCTARTPSAIRGSRRPRRPPAGNGWVSTRRARGGGRTEIARDLAAFFDGLGGGFPLLDAAVAARYPDSRRTPRCGFRANALRGSRRRSSRRRRSIARGARSPVSDFDLTGLSRSLRGASDRPRLGGPSVFARDGEPSDVRNERKGHDARPNRAASASAASAARARPPRRVMRRGRPPLTIRAARARRLPAGALTKPACSTDPRPRRARRSGRWTSPRSTASPRAR